MSLLGIDIGTTGCKAAVFNTGGKLLSSAYCEYNVIREQPGQAELDSREVSSKIFQVIREVAVVTASDPVTAISAASMGEAMVPLDRDDQITGNSILGFDARGIPYLETVREKIPDEKFYFLTGQPPGPGYSLTAFRYLAEKKTSEYAKTACYLPWADYVTFLLTGEKHMTESFAARTLLYDRIKHGWSDEIADAAAFHLAKLPAMIPSGTVCGRILPETARDLGLSPHAVVISGIHDQCAATLGTGVYKPGTAMLGLGTFACLVIVHSGAEAFEKIAPLGLTFEPYVIPGQFVSFIYHSSGGALIKWLRDNMFRDLAGKDVYQRMDEEIDVNSPNSAWVLPYFSETGPLDHAPGGQGVIGGLSFAHTRGDILKGAMDGTIFYFGDALETLSKKGITLAKIHLSGGGASSRYWRQAVADILNLPVEYSDVTECGALGCAMAAGTATGVFGSYAEAAKEMIQSGSKIEPLPMRAETYDSSFNAYRKALKNNIKRNGNTGKGTQKNQRKSAF